jgi:hypothetical protein
VYTGGNKHTKATDMKEIHDVMQMNVFLNPVEEVVIDNDEDIFADIVLAHSIDEGRAYETDEESS